jgi:acyl-CoA thioester hydrolase
VKPDAPQDTRANFPRLFEVQTRWDDNDVYGHVNNVVYYAYFDTVINRYLIDEGGLSLHQGDLGVCVESQCRYLRSLAFPERVEAGLRVAKLGRSSVTYEVGIFGTGVELCALGSFVHVFVDRQERRPVPIPERIRFALEKLIPAE